MHAFPDLPAKFFPPSFPQIVEFNVRMQGESKVQAIITKVTNSYCLQTKKSILQTCVQCPSQAPSLFYPPTTSFSFRPSPKAAFATARSKKTSPTANLLPPPTLQPPPKQQRQPLPPALNLPSPLHRLQARLRETPTRLRRRLRRVLVAQR